MFPIDVDFERDFETESGEKGTKKVKRTLFSRMNPYPQNKIMTFNKHVKDFTFNVNYEDIDNLGETEVAYLGSPNVYQALVKGVAEALAKNTGDNIETKGVKAHFSLDESGILTCTHIESVFEKTISPEKQDAAEKKEEEKRDDTWAKLGSTISQFFSGDEKADGEKKTETGEEKILDEGEKKEDKKEEKNKKERKRIKKRRRVMRKKRRRRKNQRSRRLRLRRRS